MSPSGFVVTEEKTSTLLALIVDKKGIFGPDIAQKIHEGITTVLVTAKEEQSHGNILVIPYTKTIPEIPEGNYSHMFFVWDGKAETLHVLEPLLQKAALDKAQFVFVTDHHCYNEKLVRFIHQEWARASIIFTGDIFGNDHYVSQVTTFFHEAHKNGTIQLENVGLKHVYPVLFSDVVESLVRVGFSAEKGKVLLACQRHGITELSLVHALQKVDPLIRVDFKKEERQPIFLPEGEYLFDSTYDVVRKIQDTYTDFAVSKKKEGSSSKEAFFSPLMLQREKKVQKKRKKRWMGALLLLLLIIIFPILFTCIYAGLGAAVLYAAGNAAKTGDYTHATQFSQTSESLFTTALSAEDISQKELAILFLGNVGNTLTNSIQTGKLFAELLTDGVKAMQSFSLVAKGISLSPSSDFLTGIQAIKSALLTIESTPVITIAGMPRDEISREVQPLGSVLDVSPALFGFPEKKTYLVLFQNNMELRPGGGFIGSYALMTVDKGKISDFQIHDVYDADGQLKGHVEPPYVLRRYIPQVHWYLRDSNFDVDFTQDSANAALFLQEETGQRVDGVIGVDLTFVKNVLAVIGPVYVPEYNETVNTDNFFLRTEVHAEKNSFAGSTQKKDFLAALFSAIQKKVTGGNTFSPKALPLLLSSLQSKDILFGFSDPLVQDVFTVNGLSGALWDGRKEDKSTINDITGMNEANIGVDKANYFVSRSVSQTMSVDKTGSVSGQLHIVYMNASQKNTWPGGDYKNYVRFVLPAGAVLTGVKIDGVTRTIVSAVTDFHVYEAKGFIPPKGLEVDSVAEEGKQLFGFVTTVPAEGTQQILVSYALPNVDLSQPTLTYNGWLFKEPGVETYPYDFSLSVPNTFSLLQKPDWITGSGNAVSFKKPFGQDTQFSVVFSQK